MTINAVSRYLELSPKLPHGWGEMKYSDSRRYRGQWVRGGREGCGGLISPGSLATTLTGQWLRDKQTGWGRIHYSNGAAFKGNWVRLDTVSSSDFQPLHKITNKNQRFPLVKILKTQIHPALSPRNCKEDSSGLI